MRGFKALRAVCLFAGLLVCWLEGLAKHVKVPARGEGPPHSLRVKEIKRLREGPPPYLANEQTKRALCARLRLQHPRIVGPFNRRLIRCFDTHG